MKKIRADALPTRRTWDIDRFSVSLRMRVYALLQECAAHEGFRPEVADRPTFRPGSALRAQ